MSRRVGLVLLRGTSAAIPLHLESIITSYLGPPPNITLSKTCSFGSIALLDWMWEASCTRLSDRTPWWSLTNFLRIDPHYYRHQFAESMIIATKRGDSVVVKWLLEHFEGCVVPGEAVAGAADKGHLHILKLLWDHDNGCPDRGGRHTKKRKVVTSSGDTVFRTPSGKNAVCWEVSAGVRARHPDVARWLHEHCPRKTNFELEEAIRAAVNVDLELAKFLLPHGRCLLDYADNSTNPEMVEWMLDCGYLQRDGNIATLALRHLAGSSDNVPLMRRIGDQHKQWDDDYWYDNWFAAMDEACKRGQLRTLQWLIEYPFGVEICEEMRQDGWPYDRAIPALKQVPAGVDFLQYVHEQGLFDDDVTNPLLLRAIKIGQPLEVLKWLADHADPERLPQYCVIDEAAARGRLEILQYFQQLQLSALSRNACHRGNEENAVTNVDTPLWCSTQAMDRAAANGHLDVVKWLHENRPEGCTVAAMDGAACYGDLKIVKWLHANRSEGCTVAAMNNAAARGHAKTVKWLHENTNAGCTTDAMDNAARGGHLESLEWLHGNTSEGCTVKAINNALGFEHFGVASWLHEHFPQYVPAKLERYVFRVHSFEELLFRQEHYGDIFTSEFLQGLKDPSRVDSEWERGEMWSWVKTKYLDT